MAVFKAGRRFLFVSDVGAGSGEVPFKDEGELKDILATWEVTDTEDRQYEQASEKLLTEFWAATNFEPDALDGIMQESKIKNPFL